MFGDPELLSAHSISWLFSGISAKTYPGHYFSDLSWGGLGLTGDFGCMSGESARNFRENVGWTA